MIPFWMPQYWIIRHGFISSAATTQLFYIDISHVSPLKTCSVTEMGVGDVDCIIFGNTADFKNFKRIKKVL